MRYRIEIMPGAEALLRAFPAREQRIFEAAIEARLVHGPLGLCKAIKRMRPNPLAEYALRVGDLRVLYNVEGDVVYLVVFGRKVGNKLIVEGKEFYGHQDNPIQSPRSESEGDPE